MLLRLASQTALVLILAVALSVFGPLLASAGWALWVAAGSFWAIWGAIVLHRHMSNPSTDVGF